MAEAVAAASGSEPEIAVASYFEVHVRRNDRWMIDCTAHTSDVAVAEAEEIARKADVNAVKVINERYNPATDQSAARVIFKVEKRRRTRRSDGPRLMAQPRVQHPMSVASLASAGPAHLSGVEKVEREADSAIVAAATIDPPETAAIDLASRSSASAGPWLLFAWASIALAVAAAVLFILLLLIT